MREIKFRGWDKEKERMMPVTLMEFNQWWVSCMPISDMESNVLEYGERNSFRNEDTDRHVLMQYTGIADKNGMEIYEGDIVTTDIERPYLIVEFRAGCFMFNCNDGGEDYYDIMLPVMIKPQTTYKYGEVIGNIYENPELLK